MLGRLAAGLPEWNMVAKPRFLATAAAADLNAVPPLGIEGIDPMDNGADRDGVRVFGAIGVGNYKMKLHKACVARLFTRNDLVLDAETIDDVAREMPPSRG